MFTYEESLNQIFQAQPATTVDEVPVYQSS